MNTTISHAQYTKLPFRNFSSIAFAPTRFLPRNLPREISFAVLYSPTHYLQAWRGIHPTPYVDKNITLLSFEKSKKGPTVKHRIFNIIRFIVSAIHVVSCLINRPKWRAHLITVTDTVQLLGLIPPTQSLSPSESECGTNF